MTAVIRERGWWYPYIFVGCFVVIVGVNGALAYFATSTFTGLETEGAYQKGLAYNQNLAAAKAQEALGWDVDTKVSTESVTASGAKVSIAITYRDRDGKPVEGLAVVADLIRPTAKGMDRQETLKPLGNGVYGGSYTLPVAGNWRMEVAANGDGASYQLAQKLDIR
ncbi:MAG: FixH family protein [Bacteroidota bacterium]